LSFFYGELPAYLRRDFRRIYGEMEPVFPLADINAMRLLVEAALTRGRTARIEGFGLRKATGERRIRKAAALLCHGKPWSTSYSRRGDLVFVQPAAT